MWIKYESDICLLATCSTLVSCLACSLTLKMEAMCGSETSVDFQQTTQHHIPEDRTPKHSCENIRSYVVFVCHHCVLWMLMYLSHFPSFYFPVFRCTTQKVKASAVNFVTSSQMTTCLQVTAPKRQKNYLSNSGCGRPTLSFIKPFWFWFGLIYCKCHCTTRKGPNEILLVSIEFFDGFRLNWHMSLQLYRYCHNKISFTLLFFKTRIIKVHNCVI
jgi:hypothetical protein